MRRKESDFASLASSRAAVHLASLVRQARLPRGWSQAELAERARLSAPTMHRIEQGAVQTSLGAWLAVLERLGLLHLVENSRDPASAALLDATRAQRPRRKSSVSRDLGFGAVAERIVFIHLPGKLEAVPAGRSTIIEQGTQVQASRFAYP